MEERTTDITNLINERVACCVSKATLKIQKLNTKPKEVHAGTRRQCQTTYDQGSITLS